MKIKNALMTFLAAATLSTAVSAAEPLRVGVEAAYPPFSFKEADGTLGGFDIDFARAMCEEINRECVLVEQEWDSMIPGLLARKYDVIIASMSITDERKKKIDFSEKYYSISPALVAKADADFAPTAEGLAGKRLGVLRATTHQCTAESMFAGAELVLYDTQDAIFQDLASGRLDVQLSDSLQASEGFLQQDMGKGFAFLGDLIHDPECQGEGAGIALRKGNEELREQLSAGIKSLVASGGFKAINDKYFDVDIYGK